VNLKGVLNFAQISLTSGTTYNVFCGTAPSNQRIAITGFGFFGTLNAAGTPGLLQFCDATSGGSGGTTLTPRPLEPECTETFQSTWLSLPSTAPTSIVGKDSREVNPQMGLTEYFPMGDEWMLKGGGFFVLQFVCQATGNYSGWLRINE
jgi:hypothetical protein